MTKEKSHSLSIVPRQNYKLASREQETINFFGHASDKLVESCSAEPTIKQKFESFAIVSRFITQENSGLTCSYSWATLILLPFLSITSSVPSRGKKPGFATIHKIPRKAKFSEFFHPIISKLDSM